MSLSKEEIKSVKGLLTFIPENPVIFDVGSNKGEWSDIIMEEFKENCDVHFFEPNDILLNYTKIKYDYNTNIIYNELAVADECWSNVPFYYFDDFHNGLSSLCKNPQWDNLPRKEKGVGTITLDQYGKINSIAQIDFLKIDVEGAEVWVINGAKELLYKDKIKIIQIEYSPHYKCANRKFQDIIDICKPLGYKFYTFNANKNNYDEVDTEKFVEDYRFENFIITKYLISNQNTEWNKMFIENTKDLGKVELAIEIGSNEGSTSKYICENLLEEGGRLICIDPLEDFYRTPNDIDWFKNQYERFLRNTKGLPINLYRDKSNLVLPKLIDLRAGFIYVDGDHSRKSVYQDAIDSFQITKVGGHILFDDYSPKYDYGETNAGIKEFLERNHGHYEIIKENYQLLIRKIKDFNV